MPRLLNMPRMPRPADLKAVWADEERRKRLLFILNGILINSSVVLSSGVFLSGYLVLLGGSDFLVGLMNNSMNWAAIAGLFSFLVFERMERRKPLLLTLLVLSRLLVCSIIFLPLLGTGPAILPILTTMVISGNILWGIFSIGFTIWMMNSFDSGARSAFIFKRTFWLRIAFTLFNITMGFVLDWSGKSYTGFLIVFATSLVLSIADAAVLLGVKEPPNTIDRSTRFNARLFFEPFRNTRYRSFMIFIFLFYSSLTLSSSFTSLYLVRYMAFDYSFISIVTVISNLFMIVCTRLWHKAEGRIGMMKAFKLTGIIIALEFFIYAFLTQRTYFLLYFSPILAGAGNSGFNIFVMNYRYELMPDRNRTIYEGWFGALFGLSLLVGPILGSQIMQRLPVIENALFQYSRFQLMYLISFLLAMPILLLSFSARKLQPRPDRGASRTM